MRSSPRFRVICIFESDLGYLSLVAHDDSLFDTDFKAKC